MKRLRILVLGVRLAVAGGRPAWTRVVLMAAGFAVGTALLLAAMSVPPALQARDGREYARYGEVVGRRATDAALVTSSTERYADLAFEAYWIAPEGDAPVPPGIPRIPGPGEMFVSPALGERWSGEVAAGLERRLSSAPVGTIGREGVVEEGELIAWIGGNDEDFRPGWSWRLASFTADSIEDGPTDLGATLTLLAIASAIVIPIWLFVATATRLSAATRERRLAAVRLAGATVSQVRSLASVEAGVAAAVGVVLGIPLFLAFRHVMADGLIVDIALYPEDFRPPVALAAAVLIALPAFATAMSLASIRRLAVSPLGVARHASRRHAGWRWAIVLSVGVGILSLAASQHAQLMQRQQFEVATVIIGGLACVAFGLVGTSMWLAWVVAGWLAERARSVGSTLASRRLEADPTSVGRVIGGVALLVGTAGVLIAGVSAVERDDVAFGVAPWMTRLPASTLILQSLGDRDAAQGFVSLSEVDGVVSVERTGMSPFGGTTNHRGNAIVRTDGDPATIEAVRDELPRGVDAPTVGELRAEQGPAPYDQVRLAFWGLAVFLLVVNGASLLLAMVDWIMERRRALAVLSAVGVAASVIRRSILAQVSLPLVISVSLGMLAAAGVTALFYVAIEFPVEIPWAWLVALAAAAFVVAMLVTAATLPWVRSARSPELLRNE